MPGMDGIEATRQLVADGDGVKVIALSGRADVRSAREILRVGATGFVRKESAFNELAAALHAVMADHVYLSPEMPELMAAETCNGDDCPAVTLSPREREVLHLLADGKATKEIARKLHVSVKTVETHRRNFMAKLGLYSVAELTKYAIRQGVTSVDA
jgi:two-component system, NarL family, response regulator NreC